MKNFLNFLIILLSTPYFLLSNLIFAQEYTGQLPLAAVKEPPQSLFARVPSASSVEPPPVLIFRKPTAVIRNKNRLTKALRIMVFRHPLSFSSFFHQYQNSTILILKLIGLTPRQVRRVSVVCFKTLVYEGPFAQQVIFKIAKSGANGDTEPCLATIEYEEQIGSGHMETLQSKFSLPQ